MTLLRFGVRAVNPAAGLLPVFGDEIDPPERKRFGWMQIGPAKVRKAMVRILQTQFQRRETEVDRAGPAVAEVETGLTEHWRLHRDGPGGVRGAIAAA